MSDDPSRELHPDYYNVVPGMQPWDIIKAYGLDYWKGTVLAYILRAGRKPGSSEYQDMLKAYTFLGEHLRELEKASHTVVIKDGPAGTGRHA